MADYLLTGVDDKLWRLFKASCDVQGITIKEFFLDCIDTSVKVFRQQLDYHKTHHDIPKKGGKKA